MKDVHTGHCCGLEAHGCKYGDSDCTMVGKGPGAYCEYCYEAAHPEPGTPAARLKYLLEELDKRFPGVVNPVDSAPDEEKYLAEIDRLLKDADTFYRWTDPRNNHKCVF